MGSPSETQGFVPASLLGTVIDGRYRLLAHLASGGMGAVFRAEHVYMKSPLALKVLKPEIAGVCDVAERFRREAQIAASLDHENIVRVTDFGRSADGLLFLAMELLEGESLRQRLDRSGPLTTNDALAVLGQVCSAVGAAHERKIVHRDLKPENIFLPSATDGVLRAKVLDFGIAKITDGTGGNPTQMGLVLGTPRYLAPEQAAGQPVDARSDVYSLGLLAWNMLAGRHPFEGSNANALLLRQATEPIPSLGRACPELLSRPRLIAAVAKACAKDPSDRFLDARALRAEIDACAQEVPARGAKDQATHRMRAPSLPSSSGPNRSAVSVLALSWRMRSAFAEWRERLRAAPVESLSNVWTRAVDGVRRLFASRRASSLVFAALLGVAAPVAGVWLNRSRPLHRAERLLADGRVDAARDIIERAISEDPRDPTLEVAHGHILHRLPGRAESGIAAYERAWELDPSAIAEEQSIRDLIDDLGRDAELADHAARMLRELDDAALPAIMRAARSAKGFVKLRALLLVKDLKAGDRVDRMQGFIDLLAEEDCDLRKQAARELGDLGDVRALPKLKDLATAKTKSVTLGIFEQTVSACGAQEAQRAMKKIQSARSRIP
jgi:serine/threonine-protein kinase